MKHTSMNSQCFSHTIKMLPFQWWSLCVAVAPQYPWSLVGAVARDCHGRRWKRAEACDQGCNMLVLIEVLSVILASHTWWSSTRIKQTYSIKYPMTTKYITFIWRNVRLLIKRMKICHIGSNRWIIDYHTLFNIVLSASVETVSNKSPPRVAWKKNNDIDMLS